MSEATRGRWHVNAEGKTSKCTAEKGKCPYRSGEDGGTGLGHFDTAAEAKKAYEDSVAAGKTTNGLKKNSSGRDASATAAAEHERLTTLITEKIPLKDDRSGKVPVLEPGDDSVRAQAKLATYLWKNFDGDADEAEVKALESLYGSPLESPDPSACSLGIGDDGSELTAEQAERRQNRFNRLQRYRQQLRDKLGGAEVSLYWQDGHAVYVARGKRSAATMKPDAKFSSMNVPVRILNTGSLLAAESVVGEMERQNDGEYPQEAKRALATALMENRKRAVDVAQLNGQEYYSKSLSEMSRMMPVAKRRFGVDLGEPPVIRPHGDNSESISYSKRALAALDELDAEGKIPAGQQNALKYYRGLLRGHLEDCYLNQIGQRGDYKKAMSALLDDETDSQANYRYLKRISGKHSATVYEDKKNRDPEHDAAGKASAFAADFGRIEVDDSVDLSKFSKLSSEYSDYKSMLPASSESPDLRFRMTGRHHATGVYTIVDGRKNMAVDPRAPHSFTHEWFHHLDFSTPDGQQISRDPEFKAIVAHYKETVDRDAMGGSDPDRYLAPTEIFARAGELWMHERDKEAGGCSSFLDTDEAYENDFDYKPLLDMRDEVIAFMDKKFGTKKA